MINTAITTTFGAPLNHRLKRTNSILLDQDSSKIKKLINIYKDVLLMGYPENES